MMKMSDIISKYYQELYDMLREKDSMISEAKTDEDHLQDVCLMALKVWKDKEVEEEEGKAYLVKSLLMALKFKRKRINRNVQSFEDLPDYQDIPDKWEE